MSDTNKVEAKAVRFKLDDAAILAVTAKISLQNSAELTVSDLAVLAALRRAHPSAGQSPEELGQWLAKMDESQLRGVVSNTKGVLHEMLFVELENDDGDAVYAAQFEATNHPGFDIKFVDELSGQNWSAQMKATDSEPYVREWLEKHPGGEILVTSEIADRIGIESSGISNAELTADTSRLVDTLVGADQNDVIWDYVPALSALSVGIVIWELNGRLQRQEITRSQFKRMAAKLGGQRAARVLGLSVLMSIPGVNVITMISLIATNLESIGVGKKIDQWITDETLRKEGTREYATAIFRERTAIDYAVEAATKGIEGEAMLRGMDEIGRGFSRDAYKELEAVFKPDEQTTTAAKFIEYTDPERCRPKLTGCSTIDREIEAAFIELQSKREAELASARNFLKVRQRVVLFNQALEEIVSPVAAESIMLQLMTDPQTAV